MLDDNELQQMISQTLAFINADNETITLCGMTETADGRGGKKRTWPTANNRESQVFRLIPRSSVNDRISEITGSDGKIAIIEFVLLGLPDSEVERYDRFEKFGSTWEIAQIHVGTSNYELKGDVIRVGR